MRVLRRVKEILRREDVTYERARRELAGEGLLTYEPDEHESPNGKAAGRPRPAPGRPRAPPPSGSSSKWSSVRSRG
jgi:hypothetical protein